MKKALKIFAVLAVVVAVVLFLSNTALRLLLPPEKAKALVLKQLTGHLKRDVTMGDVSVGLLSGLQVTDLKISESPNFARGTFISSHQFSIRLALLPLIFRKVEVKQFALDHPVINLVRYPDGKTFNFSDLMGPPAVPAAKPTAALPETFNPFALPQAYAGTLPAASPKDVEPPFALVISHAEIKNGILHFVDQSAAKQSADIDPLDLKLNNVSLTSPFSVQTSLKAKVRGIVLALKLAGEAALGPGSFKIKTCTLSSGGSTLSLTGSASRLKSNQPAVDLNLDVKEFKLSTLAPFAALPPGLKLEGPILAHALIKGDQKKMDVTAAVDLEKVQVAYAGQFSKPARVPMSVSLKADVTELKDLNIAELKAVLGSMQLLGHGKVSGVNTDQPQINLHLETNPFPVMQVAEFAAAALPKGVVLKGRAQVSADVSGTQASSRVAAKLDGSDLDITMDDQFQKPSGTVLRLAVVGEVLQAGGKKAATSQTINFQMLSAALGPVELNGSGSVQTGAAAAHFQLALKSNSFPLQDFAKLVPLLAPYRLSGTVGADVHVSGTSAAPQAAGSVMLQDVAARYQQSDVSHIAAAMTFSQQDVSIPKLTGKLNGSDIALKLTGHHLQTQPDVAVEANVAELDLAKLLPPPSAQSAELRAQEFLMAELCSLSWAATAWAAAPPAMMPPMKLTGHLTVGHIKHDLYDAQSLDVKWNLTDVTPDLARINGTAALKQGPGKMQNLDKLAATSKSARVFLLPLITIQKLDKNGILKSMGIPSLQTITFTSIHGDYVFRSGIMDIKAFDLIGQDLNLNTLGTIGLAGVQPLDVHVTMKLAAGSMRGTLGQIMSDESGRPTLAFTAKGTVASPDVKPDLQDVGRKALQQVGQQLLQGFGIGGSQTPPPPASGGSAPSATPPPPSPQQPSVDDLQKAFKNIFH